MTDESTTTVEVDTDELANMTNQELSELASKLGMTVNGIPRDEVLSRILCCAVKVG